MDWWFGFNQCWPMGPKCTVDWDAWALPIAVVAAIVSWLGVIVTAASAGAVYWLGKQANNLAMSGQAEAGRQRAFDMRKVEDERVREERVMLCFLLAELQELASSAGAIRDMLLHPDIGLKAFIESAETRSVITELSPWLETDRIETCFDRLHKISEPTGLKLAALFGNCHFIRMRMKVFPERKSPSEYGAELERITAHSWLASTYNRLLVELESAHLRASHCLDLANCAMNALKEEAVADARNGSSGDGGAREVPPSS